jgi:hypothetical protein
MAKEFGFANPTEFAFVVEGWTQKQRTDSLERFYLKRKERLAELEAENRTAEDVSGHILGSGFETDDDDDEL